MLADAVGYLHARVQTNAVFVADCGPHRRTRMPALAFLWAGGTLCCASRRRAAKATAESGLTLIVFYALLNQSVTRWITSLCQLARTVLGRSTFSRAFLRGRRCVVYSFSPLFYQFSSRMSEPRMPAATSFWH